MKIALSGLVERAEQALRNCLEGIPFVRVRSVVLDASLGDLRSDLLVTLDLAGKPRRLVVEVKNNGQPKVARAAVNQLLRYRETDPVAYGVFVAPYMSSSSAAVCAEAGVGYVDLAGNCRLSFDSVYVERQGSPNPFAEKRDLRSLYSPKASRVLRVLLEEPNRAWRTQALADEAKVSLGQVANVKKLLADREWIRVGAEGFTLREAERLLVEWAQNYSFRKNRATDYYSLKPVAQVEAELGLVCRAQGQACALTAFSGAARLAPAVRYQRVFAFVRSKETEIARQLSLKGVASGANVTLLAPYDDGVLYAAREIEGVPVASPIQIYLDLAGIKGRGEEAAQVLLEEVIRRKW